MTSADIRSPSVLMRIVAAVTCLALAGLFAMALLSGYYAQSCSSGGFGWGLFMLLALLLMFPYATVPAWFLLAFALARWLKPARSGERYAGVLAASVLAAGVLFCLGLLFAVATRASGGCSIGF